MQTEMFSDSAAAEEIALEDLFKAYYECRKHKRRTVNALAFELNFERELIRLWREINSGTYKIGRSIAFVVQKPVQREVFAADFRDRIVHHLVISKLNYLFEGSFIEDSYSCREGKGILYGVNRISAKMEACSEAFSCDCYVMKLDIRSFFMKIDKNILYRRLLEFISENYQKPDKRIILRLVKQIIYNAPEDNCHIKGRRSDWNGLPFYKSLFWAEKFRGLPIGNLTSQIFANFYLNALDRFVTEELKIEHYGRYVDDFVLIHPDKAVLLDARKKIDAFLQKKLKLSLHPQKFYLQHWSKGVSFIGAVIKRHCIYVGNRSKGNLYQKVHVRLPRLLKNVKSFLSGLPSLVSTINSYLGAMRHYNTYNLRSKILRELDKTTLGIVSELRPDAKKFAVDKRFLPPKQKQFELRRQRSNRKKQLKQLIKKLKG